MAERIVSLRVRVEDDGSVRVLGQVEDSIEGVGRAAKTSSRDQAGLNAETKKFGPAANEARDGAVRLKTALQLIGAVAVAAVFRNAREEALAFGRGMAEVSTLLDDTSVIPQLTADVERLAVQYGQMPRAQIKALYDIISAGSTNAADAIAVLTASNKLAVGGVTQVDRAADGLTSTLNAYASANYTADQVSDKFFATMRIGKTTIEQISDSIGKVATNAEQTGVQLDELLAAYATLTSTGTRTSTAMEGLRAVIASILKPSEEARELAAQLGIEFDVAALRSKGLSGFLAEVADKTDGAADAIATLFGGTEAITPVLSLAGARAEAFADNLETVRNSAGETDKAVAKMSESAAFLQDQFDATMATIQRGVGDGLVKGLSPALASATENAEALKAAAERLGFVLGESLGIASETAALLLDNINLVEAAVGALIAVQLVRWLGSVAAAFLSAQAAAGGFFALLSAHPIGAVAAAVGALVGAYILLTNETHEARSAQTDYNAALETARGRLESLATAEQKAALAIAERTVRMRESSLVAAENRLNALQPGDDPSEALDRLERARDGIQGARLDLAALYAEIDAGTAAVAGAAGAGGGNSNSPLAKLDEDAQSLLASLDNVGAGVAAYREGLAVLDTAVASGSISQAEYNLLLAELDTRLKDTLGNEPANAVRAWADATDDLNDRTLVLTQLEEALGERTGRRIEQLAVLREGMAEELRLMGLSEEQRQVELLTHELLNAARAAGIDLTEEAARNEARAHVEKIGAIEAQRAALNRNQELLRRFTGEIETGFKDAFKEAFREGEGGFDRLMSSFENMFLDMLAELAFQALARPIMVPIVQAVGGALGVSQGGIGQVLGNAGFGVPGTTGPTGINLGGGGGLGGGLGDLGSLFNGFSQSPGFINDFIFGSTGQSLGLSSLGAGGIGPAAPTAFGNALGNLTSPAGAAGGFAGNFLGNAIFGGDRGIGADIGGSIGAVAGSFIPIPFVGTAIGSLLGNFIGGLFGGGGGDPIGHTNIALSGNRLTVGASGADNGADPAATQQAAAEAVQLINQIADQLGLDIIGTVGAASVGQGGAPGPASAQQAVDAFFANAPQNLRGETAAINRIIAEGGGVETLATRIAEVRDLEQILAAMSFEDPLEGLTQTEAAIRTLTDEMASLRQRALAVGLAIDTINEYEARQLEAMRTGFDENTFDSILSATDPVRYAWERLMDNQELRLRDAIALGADLAAAEHLNLLERSAFVAQLGERERERLNELLGLNDDLAYQIGASRSALGLLAQDQSRAMQTAAGEARQLADSLRSFAVSSRDAVFALRVGGASPLSPETQRLELFDRLNALATDAFENGNTSALQALPQVAAQFIDASRAYFADSQLFNADFDFATGLLEQAAAVAEAQADLADADASLLESQLDVLSEILVALQSTSPDATLLEAQLAELSALTGESTPLYAALADLVALTATDQTSAIEAEAARLASERMSAIEAASAERIAAAQAEADRRAAAAEAQAAARVAAAEAALAEQVRANAANEALAALPGIIEQFTTRYSASDQERTLVNVNAVMATAEFALARSIDPERAFAALGMAVPAGFSGGGHVLGAGTSTSDSIPARLSHGEYVIRAAAVDQYGPAFLDQVNAGALGVASGGGDASGILKALGDIALRMERVEQAVLSAGDGTIGAIEDGNATREIIRRDNEQTNFMLRRDAGRRGARS
ncbi:phage tail tape measure protein [Pyruvatibacter sp.]|uniref:phage tail tape measure protein n=1 Tax=Pyruvatibacter sp. TaxID=1981328 RepID=UPI0032EE9F47